MQSNKVCFNAALSEVYPPIEILGIMIDPVAALQALEPAHYACLEAEWNRQTVAGQLDFFLKSQPVLKLVT